MRGQWFSAMALVLICLGAQSPPAVAAGPKDAGSKEDTLDEVVVQGRKLYELRKQIVEAEDRFVARYNELNQKHEYDIHCHPQEQTTGTLLRSRVCKVQIVEEAERDEARDLLDMMNSATPASAMAHAPTTAMVAQTHEDDYRQNMLSLLRQYPELRKMAIERGDLAKRYDAERKKRLKGKLVLIE